MHTGAVEEHRIDGSHSYIHHDRPSSGEIEEQRASERNAAEPAIAAAVEGPMSRLRAACDAALLEGRVSVSGLQPDELAAALPGRIRDAQDRMDKAARAFQGLVAGVAAAAEQARREHPPVSAGAADTVRAMLAAGVTSATAGANMAVGRVTARVSDLRRESKRLSDAAARIAHKRAQLEADERELAELAQQAAGRLA